MYRVIVSSFAAIAMSVMIAPRAEAVEVYLFKGAGDFSFVNENMHFSRGLNKIADTLNAEGIHSEVRRFSAIEDALAAIRDRRPESIALIGHSMGALASMAMARNLRGQGIRIAYMGLIDIPGPVGVAGDNVEKVENYYSINPVYGKLTNVNSHPDAKNIHVFGYIHNRMDDAPKVQEGMLAAIREIHRLEQLEEQGEPPALMVDAGVPVRPVETQQLVPSPEVQVVETTAVSTTEVPYALPSVSGQQVYESQDPLLAVNTNPSSTGVQSRAQLNPGSAGQDLVPPLPVQQVNPVTTASVVQRQRPSLLQRGRKLLRRTSAFVRNLSSAETGKPARPIDEFER